MPSSLSREAQNEALRLNAARLKKHYEALRRANIFCRICGKGYGDLKRHGYVGKDGFTFCMDHQRHLRLFT